MTKKIKTEDNTKHNWDDIFDSIDMTYFPIEYIDRIVLTFQDGTVWDIDVNDSRRKQTVEQIENSLDDLFEEYDEFIESIDFRLDLERAKKDLSKRVYKFLKLNR